MNTITIELTQAQADQLIMTLSRASSQHPYDYFVIDAHVASIKEAQGKP